MLNGLADNTVNCILKDQKGFIWFGTNNGISRYDGKTIRTFNDPDRYLKIHALKEASNGFLWMISNGELLAFDPRQEKIHSVRYQDSPFYSVRDFTIDSDSSIWVVKRGTLQKITLDFSDLHETNGTLRVSRAESIQLKERVNHIVANLCTVSPDTLALVTLMGEVVLLDKKAPYECLIRSCASGMEFTPMALFYENNQLWISTIGSGAIHYSIQSERFTRYTYLNTKPTFFSHQGVYEITSLHDGRFLACTWNGVTVLEPDSSNNGFTTTVFNNRTSDYYKNVESRILSAYYDEVAEKLWVGTNGGGVIESDLRQSFYKQSHQKTHNEIWNIAFDEKNRVWLTSFHDGIMRSPEPFDENKELEFFTVNDRFADKGALYRCMVQDSSGNFWFAGSNGSFIHYVPQTDKKSYYSLPLNGRELQNTDILSLLLDEKNQLWIGTDKGLFRTDEKSRNKPRKMITDAPHNNLFIRCLASDAQHNIWIGSHTGLKRYGDGKVKDYSRIYPSDIRSLLFSKDGNLYIGTQNGLFVHDCEADTTRMVYTTRNGLCNNFIGCLTEDAKGRLWIGSNSGISKLNREQGIFYHFYISGNNRTVFLRDSLLMWGNNKSVTYFNPYKTGSKSHISRHVYITQLEVNNECVQVNGKINGQVILKEEISSAKEINLNHKNNKFSLHFSNLSFTSEPQKYYYRLYPYEKEWLIAEENEKIAYAMLPHGKYRFEVKTLLQDDSTGPVTTLNVEIQPHWSHTVWFYLFCFTSLVMLFLYAWRRNRIIQKRKENAAALNQELKRVTYEREQEKQLNRERINFFTNVSHELRTPLTLITAPLSELINDDQIPAKSRSRLKLIDEHARLLQSTVNELLYLQKINASLVKINATNQDMAALIRKVVNSFGELVALNELDLKLELESDIIDFSFDGSKMESAIRNLLSNAIKYTPKGGIIRVEVSSVEVDERHYCRIDVCDNGPGIAKEKQHNIFDSFITTENEPLLSTKMGLGLQIVKNTIDLHHGTIELESEKGKGCRFILTIPMDPSDTLLREKTPDLDQKESLRESGPEKPEGIVGKRHSGKKLLIIEDNAAIRSYVCSLFEEEYHLLWAENGKEGLNRIAEFKPDLILSDIMMPVKDGFEVCREIKEDAGTAHIPVILLTAKTEEVELIEGMKNGADDYLMKPFNPEVLKLKVENLIRSREQLKRLYTKAVIRNSNTELPDGDEQMTAEKSAFMQQTINLIETNLSNPDFNVKMLARYLNMSQPTLYRKIKKESDLSITEVIRSVRMSKSAVLLLDKRYSVQEVAEMVGFNDIATFRKHFTEQFGVAPSRYGADS